MEHINFRVVDKNHYIVKMEGLQWSKRASQPAKCFKHVVANCLATNAVVATVNHEIVGFFRYRISKKKRALRAAGTWVSVKYRKHHVGKQLWRHALRQMPQGGRVDVITVSRGGSKLVTSIIDEWSSLSFCHMRNK